MEYRRIFKDGIHLFAGKMGTVVAGLAVTMILTRILTTEQMGQYSLFFLVINLGVMLAFSWSDSSIVRHGREEFVHTKKINKTFWARLYLLIPLLSLFILIYIVFRNQIADFITLDHHMILYVIPLFIMTGLLSYLSNTYRSIDRISVSAYILFMQKLLFLIGLLLMFFKVITVTVFGIIILINISFIITLVFFMAGFDVKQILPYTFDKAYFRKIWSYSWPQLIGFSGLYVINYIDLFVIRRFMTINDVGIYSIAYKGFEVITGMILLINTLFLPLIVEYKTTKRFDYIKSYTRKIPLFIAGWIVLVVIGLLSSGFVIPLVFSEKYVASIPSFNILLIASAVYFASICLIPLINAFDLILLSQVFNLIKSAVNIICDFMLVPRLGIIGAAYGTLISYAVGLAFSAALIWYKKSLIHGVDGND